MSAKAAWRRSMSHIDYRESNNGFEPNGLGLTRTWSNGPNVHNGLGTNDFQFTRTRSMSFSKSMMAMEEQRFSLGDLFYKGRGKSRQTFDEGDEEASRMSEHRESTISMEGEFEETPAADTSQADGPQKLLSMKDQEQMLQELKKENFDLKLRLYMTEKNSETAEGKVSEYEQQLAALLQSLDEQQRLSESQTRDLHEALEREKKLKVQHKKLEETCHEQDEKIHNLSLSLNQLSTSMHELSAPKHSTPARGVQSAYYPHEEGDDDVIAHETSLGIKPFNNNQSNVSHVAPNVSHVAPMRRDVQKQNSDFNDESNASLIHNDRGIHSSVSEGNQYNTSPTTKNYYNNTSIDNRNARNEGYDNIGVVRPNNTRTEVDVEIPDNTLQVEGKKKKKKGFMNVFRLCAGGKSSDPRATSVYQKREPAKITMTTYNE